MREVIERWYHRYFSNEESAYLIFIAIVTIVSLYFFGHLLTPLFVAIILAYLMQGLVLTLKEKKVPHLVAVSFVFMLFVGFLGASLFIVLPLVWSQSLKLIDDQLPILLHKIQDALANLATSYPNYFSETQAVALSQKLQTKIGEVGEALLAFSLQSVPSLIGIMIFFVLVPMLVFFLLKDRDLLMRNLVKLLPAHRPIMNQVWSEMDRQMANYVRGKVIEIFIIGGATFVVFTFLSLKYAVLLSLMVGFSVLIPFIGAALAAVPIFAVGYFQFGWTSDLATVMGLYAILQAIDGNLLVPLLFSEAVNLHPVSIVMAVLLFGGIWGIWGVFFAIPLATLIKALWTAWPTR